MTHTAGTCLPSTLLSPRCLEVGEKQVETQHKPLSLPCTSIQFSRRIPLTPSLPACAASQISPVDPDLPPVGSGTKIPPLGISPVTQVTQPSLPSQSLPFPLADVGLFHLMLWGFATQTPSFLWRSWDSSDSQGERKEPALEVRTSQRLVPWKR